jgi:hypothetical protein
MDKLYPLDLHHAIIYYGCMMQAKSESSAPMTTIGVLRRYDER